jgi:protein gp37
MTINTGIEWTDSTWNPVRGCTRVSEGCKHCYAELLAARFSDAGMWGHGLAVRHKRPDGGMEGRWTGLVQLADDKKLLWPLRFKGHPQALAEDRPTKIFVNSTSDLFHESLPDAAIDQVYAVMALSAGRSEHKMIGSRLHQVRHNHIYQVLTKRAARMRRYLTDPLTPPRIGRAIRELQARQGWPTLTIDAADAYFRSFTSWPLPNVWLGVSAEDQATADERIPDLLASPAAIRFISAEPLLGPINLNSNLGGTLWMGGQRGCGGLHHGTGAPECPRELHHHHDDRCRRGLNWVIGGFESGPRARPGHPAWMRQLRDQCGDAGVAFFFKQWGEWAPLNQVPGIDAGDLPERDEPFRVGKHAAGAMLDGREHKAFPQVAA